MQSLVRTRYLARQHGLALSLGLAARAMAAFSPFERSPPPADQLVRLQQRFTRLLARDWQNAAAKIYPQRLLFEFSLKDFATTLPEYLRDLPKVAARARRGAVDELPAGIDRSRYPAYYLRNFHWQTDGWFSERSARLYDFGVDLLFGGTTDAMRRMALPALVSELRGKPGARVLDVAAGTGRFLAQLGAALPEAQLTGVDLSPAYLARARQKLPASVTLVEGNAEQLPFADASFDAVSCVFLFHELPRDVRRRVAGELRRVLVPGGVLSVCDSAQLSDSSDIRHFLDAFHRLFHEPYYKGYLADPLEELFAEVGFTQVHAEPHLVAKVVTARKPPATA